MRLRRGAWSPVRRKITSSSNQRSRACSIAAWLLFCLDLPEIVLLLVGDSPAADIDIETQLLEHTAKDAQCSSMMKSPAMLREVPAGSVVIVAFNMESGSRGWLETYYLVCKSFNIF